MSREDKTTREEAAVDEWLHRRHPLPRLEDLSVDGRAAFLARHQDALWDFWREAFSLAIDDGRIHPRQALGGQPLETEWAAAELAERLVDALRSRPTMDSAPAWTNVERWYAWLIGSAAARRPLEAHARDASSPRSRDDARDELLDLHRLIERWTQVLGSVVTRTGIQAIELDWLWATRRARKPLPALLNESPGTVRLLDTRLRAAIVASSAPGNSRSARTARTRDGAAACLRFNIEELATRSATPDARLVTAREVFVGPAKPRPPYLPQAPVSNEAEAGFREALRLSAGRARPLPDDGVTEQLWKGILRCALKKAVARLLPRKLTDALEADTAFWEDVHAQDEGDEP